MLGKIHIKGGQRLYEREWGILFVAELREIIESDTMRGYYEKLRICVTRPEICDTFEEPYQV